MADFTVRYADWKGGEWGVRDSAKVNADQFTGTNVVLYGSGLLGVRAGTKQMVYSGLPTHPIVPGPLGFWVFNNKLVVFLGKPYEVPFAGGAATPWTGYSDNPTPSTPVRFLTGGGVAYSLCNGRLYKHVNVSTTTLITTPAALSHIVRWGYYFVGVDANVPWRIWFSTVDSTGAHFDQWSVLDYIDVGNTEPITSLNPIFNTLYVGKRAGWNAVAGVLGTLASVRGVALGLGPVDPRLTTITTDNRVLYWPMESRPAWFNGERVYLDSQQDVGTPRSTPYTCDSVIVTPTARRLLVANEVNAQTHIRSWAGGGWSHHVFPSRLAGLVPGNVIDGYQMPSDVIFCAIAPVTVGDPVIIGAYSHNLDRPGHTSDTYAAPIDYAGTDLVAGDAAFPTYWEPIGRQVQVRSVIMQFRKWASGVAGARNQIQVAVDALGAYGRGTQSGDTQYWDEPCERSSTSGTDDSWRVNVGAQGWGNGFQLRFPKLVGVALREVIVLVSVRTERA